jgi:hypothetical protein
MCTRFLLSFAYFSLIEGRKGPIKTISLPFLCRLRFLEVHIVFSTSRRDFRILSSLMESLCISLASPATLEHLEFNIRFYNCYSDFDSNIFYEDLGDADAWSHLDSIATHLTGSRLQRVDVNIDFSEEHRAEYLAEEGPNEKDVVKAVFDGLPFLRTKGILFVEAKVEDTE